MTKAKKPPCIMCGAPGRFEVEFPIPYTGQCYCARHFFLHPQLWILLSVMAVLIGFGYFVYRVCSWAIG